MKRTKPVDTALAHEGEEMSPVVFAMSEGGDWEDADEPVVDGGQIAHARARHLIVEQANRLLPPADANALADHLLVCDPCYRFAQDEAAKERKRSSGELR